MSRRVISVEGRVAAPRHRVFVALADLDGHEALTDRRVQLLELFGSAGARSGGRVRLHGPLGLRREATTRLRTSQFPHTLAGTAHAPRNTRAALRWLLEDSGRATEVSVELEVSAGWWGDRALLRAGGAWWLRRRLRAAVSRLAEHVEPGSGRESTGPDSGPRTQTGPAVKAGPVPTGVSASAST